MAWGSFMWIYKWAQQNPLLPQLGATSSLANFLAGLQAGAWAEEEDTEQRVCVCVRDLMVMVVVTQAWE